MAFLFVCLFVLNVGAASLSERLANHRGVSCSKTEPQMEQVGEGGREPKQPLQTQSETCLFCEACKAQTKRFLTKHNMFVVGHRPLNGLIKSGNSNNRVR